MKLYVLKIINVLKIFLVLVYYNKKFEPEKIYFYTI
jgi:hypothetical protein